MEKMDQVIAHLREKNAIFHERIERQKEMGILISDEHQIEPCYFSYIIYAERVTGKMTPFKSGLFRGRNWKHPKDQFCLRVRQDSRTKTRPRSHWADVRHYRPHPKISYMEPNVKYDPYVRAMYLQEKEEMRIERDKARKVFLSGPNESVVSMIAKHGPHHAVMFKKNIMRKVGLK